MIVTILIVAALLLAILALLGVASRVDLTAAALVLACVAMLLGRVG